MRARTKRILCVDDERDICELLSTLFSHLDYEVVTADSPRAALEEVGRGAFDLYVIDTRFPGESGLDLCAALRERTPAVPVLFYSGADAEESQDAGICAGAAAYVPKSHLDDLIRMAQRLLQEHDSAAPLATP